MLNLMEEFEKRRAVILAKADAANDRIRQAESFLKAVPCRENIKRCGLLWDVSKQRVCLNDKPLIENKLAERIDGTRYLEDLIDAVITESEDITNGEEK